MDHSLKAMREEPQDDYAAWAQSLGIDTAALMDALCVVGREKFILFMGPPPEQAQAQKGLVQKIAKPHPDAVPPHEAA